MTGKKVYQWRTVDKKKIQMQRDTKDWETYQFNDQYAKAVSIDPDYEDPIILMNTIFKPSIDFTKMKKTNSMLNTGSVNNIPNDDL